MEICSHPVDVSQLRKGLNQIICMDMEKDMKTPKLTKESSCTAGDIADMYLMGGFSSASSTLSISSTTDLSSNQSTISSCKSSFKSTSTKSRSRSSSFHKPSWLLSTIADLDEKMKIVAKTKNPTETEKEEEGNEIEVDNFAQRAEAYYRTRPQLLSLLNDLYNGYISLADRYSQTLAKHHHSDQHSFPISAIHFDYNNDVYDHDNHVEEEMLMNSKHIVDFEAESSVSYQGSTSLCSPINADFVVAELVIKMVDFDIIADQLNMVEKHWNDSSKKIELQRSLIEVLESERVILLNENSMLGYKVAMLGEENKGLMGENVFMKRKASELSRHVLKMREDHRVCMLIRKIEELQGQVYTLEMRNKDYYQQIVKRDGLLMQFQKPAKKNSKNENEVPTLGDRFQLVEEAEEEKVVSTKFTRRSSGRDSDSGSSSSGRKLSEWWGRVKSLDLLQCGPHFKH